MDKITFTETDILESAYIIKVRAKLRNGWTLQIWEHKFPDLLRYSYHVLKDKVIEYEEMNVEKVLEELEKMVEE